MTPDEQEALSKRYNNETIIILRLKSGNIAVLNRGFELCGITEPADEGPNLSTWELIQSLWYPPQPPPLSQEKQEAEDVLRSAGL